MACMSDDTKQQITWAIAMVLCVTSVSWSISWYYVSESRAAFEGGYSEETLPGTIGTHWVKR